MSDVKNASTDTPRSEPYGIVHSFQGLPEPVKVAIGVGAGLSILFVPLAIYFFGGAIWRVLVILFWAGAVLGTMAGIAFLLSLSKQKSRSGPKKRGRPGRLGRVRCQPYSASGLRCSRPF